MSGSYRHGMADVPAQKDIMHAFGNYSSAAAASNAKTFCLNLFVTHTVPDATLNAEVHTVILKGSVVDH